MAKPVTLSEVFQPITQNTFDSCLQAAAQNRYQFFLYEGSVYLTLKPTRAVCKYRHLR